MKVHTIYNLVLPNLFAIASVLHAATQGIDNVFLTTFIGGAFALPVSVWTKDWISEPDNKAVELARLLVVYGIFAVYVSLLGMLTQIA